MTARGIDLKRGFEQLYLDAWPRLYRYTWLLVRNHEDAEDTAAEAVRRAYGAWLSGHGPQGDSLAWLFLIARRVVIDRHRRNPIKWLSLASTSEPADRRNHFESTEEELWFEQLRTFLTPRQHEALLLRYLFDLSDQQIGKLMGLSDGGVRTNIARAVASLRTHPEVLS